MTLRRLTTAILVLLACFLGAPRLLAHVVPTGVGTQTWYELSPTGMRLHFNVGYSSIAGFEQLMRMDRDNDRQVTAAERDAWLTELLATLRPLLDLSVDGKRLE